MRHVVFTFWMLAIAGWCLPSHAQDGAETDEREMVEQSTRHTALLDLRGTHFSVLNPDLPLWIERITPLDSRALPLATPHGFVIAFSGDVALNDGVLLQLLHNSPLGGEIKINALSSDYKRVLPEVTWQAGRHGLASRSVTLKAGGIRYVVLSSSEANNLQTLLLSLIGEQRVTKALDTDLGADPISMFRRSLVREVPYQDQELYGRVRATLLEEAERVSDRDILELEVALDELPLISAVNFQILGVDPAKQVYVEVNGNGPVTAHYTLPDLADPGYVGRLKRSDDRLGFQYLEPVAAKAIIPEEWLRVTEVNVVRIYLPEDHPEVEISDVQLELKYPWSKFTYTLEP